MNNGEAKIRDIDYEVLRNQKHNQISKVMIIFLIIGYLFFFLSPYIFHQHPEKQLTKLYEDINFKSGSLRVESWTYSEEQKLSEVCCAFTDYGDEDKLKFSAAANFSYASKSTITLNTEVRYIDSGYFVIVIKDLPEDWYCLALYIKNSSTDETKDSQSEPKTIATSGEYEPQPKSENSEASVYTCVDDVEKVNSIEKQDNKSYKIMHCERSIAQDEKLIQEYKNNVEELNNEIEDYQSQIQQLESKMTLQTSAEQEKSQEKIDEYNRYIDDNNNNIMSLNSQIEILQNDADEYRLIIENLTGQTKETVKPLDGSEQPT